MVIFPTEHPTHVTSIPVLTATNDSLVVSKPLVVHRHASLLQHGVRVVKNGGVVVVDVQGIPVVEYDVCLDFLALERRGRRFTKRP